jgi:acetolactate synthase-1/2/3 large subunit
MLSIIDELDTKPDAQAINDWWTKIDQWRADKGIYTASRYESSGGDIIKPQDVIKALYKETQGDAFITSDVGQHQMFAAQYYLFDKPRRWINSGGLGTMGFRFTSRYGCSISLSRGTGCLCYW